MRHNHPKICVTVSSIVKIEYKVFPMTGKRDTHSKRYHARPPCLSKKQESEHQKLSTGTFFTDSYRVRTHRSTGLTQTFHVDEETSL